MRGARIAVLVLGALGCASAPARVERQVGRSDAPLSPSAAWADYGPVQCTPPFPEAPAEPPPWDPPPGAPDAVVRMARRALEEGPDPRELAFHEVEIWHGTVWDHGARLRVYGFVRPGSALGERPLVWLRGEWHAAVAIGPPADLAAQCRAQLAGRGPPPLPARPSVPPLDSQARSTRERSFCPRRDAVIALAREEPELAARLATEIAGEMAETERMAPDTTVVDGDEALGWQLAFGELSRALTAHMQGDDCLALSLLRRYPLDGDTPSEGRNHAMLRALRADQERRATVPRSVVPELPADGSVPAELVPALVASLDEVDALQLSQPGGVRLEDAQAVGALLRAGTAAVPALIDAIERDARLTRSVEFFRDFAPDRHVISVREVAVHVLQRIVGTRFPVDADLYELVGAPGDARFAANLRAWWSQPAQRGAAERSLAMLRDDRLGPAAWADAATWIRGTFYAWREPGTPPFDRRGVEPPPYEVEGLGPLAMRRARDALRAGAAAEACSLARTAWNADERVLRELVALAGRCARAPACPCLDDMAASLGPSIPEIFRAAERRRAQGERDEASGRGGPRERSRRQPQ